MNELKKLKREYVLPPIEHIKFQLNQSINVPMPVLNDTNLTVLAYVHFYKGEAKKMLVSDRIISTTNSANNYFSTLRSMGYIQGYDNEGNLQLNPKILIMDEDYIQVTIVRRDNTKHEVYHPYFSKRSV